MNSNFNSNSNDFETGAHQDFEKLERLTGIVDRVTFHNPENGWSVLKVTPLGKISALKYSSISSSRNNSNNNLITVTVHQSKVFAGATLEFFGEWVNHNEYGMQFKAIKVSEKKPATVSALEKYLGSGLIHGVGPKTAQKIVRHFGSKTLEIFEEEIARLLEVSGIADQKLKMISEAWSEHREIRNIMMFLQSHQISTLYAVKIYKTYGNKSIEIVSSNPYQLAKDIYGIGFFSADKVALSMGFALDSKERIFAGIKHVLSQSKEEGHCYLLKEQVEENTGSLLEIEMSSLIEKHLKELIENNEIKVRHIKEKECFYSKSLYYDETYVANKVKQICEQKNLLVVDRERVRIWVERFTKNKNINLSEEQLLSVIEIVENPFSILTGGPGCGKTTTTNVLVKLLQAMGKKVLLAAPTGRAAQRMTEVIGVEAKTIHRLLNFNPAAGGFKINEDNPLEMDFLVVDETSMLDINLSADLLRAVPLVSKIQTNNVPQVLFIGDADQLPSVGAGNVLKDLIASEVVPVFKLTKIFRQAEESLIIRYAHEINKGLIPKIESPFNDPLAWEKNIDALFIDSEELTQEQISFIVRAKRFVKEMQKDESESAGSGKGHEKKVVMIENQEGAEDADFIIPKKFKHVDLFKLSLATNELEELKNVLKKIHPWSTINYGLRASDMLVKLYSEIIPNHLGQDKEIQILSPMLRGSLGTSQLNLHVQNKINPARLGLAEISVGNKIIRVGDRVIQKRNNYNLGVFNGDIGIVDSINIMDMECVIDFDFKTKGINKNQSRKINYKKADLLELELAYAITIHKSQGSEFDVVIIPVLTQHFKMLFRNLIYTGLTRAKKMAIFLGTRRALAMAIKNIDSRERQTLLATLLKYKL
ncbi:MAG: AAA family ATPase [Oligoflexia bacterium]|nr:AAA family ATPase [Oligoflexia bacterium]